jgi:hypothetical protein
VRGDSFGRRGARIESRRMAPPAVVLRTGTALARRRHDPQLWKAREFL